MEKRGLGKGLGALLSASTAAEDGIAVREIPTENITPNPYQPRQIMNEERLDEMVQSVKEHGILQPILVRRTSVDRYELVAGERRFRAAQAAGLRSVPAIVKEYGNQQSLEVALIENVQREDINAIEAGTAYQRLIDEFGLTQEEIAHRVGKARATIANTLRLLALPEAVRAAVQRGSITEGHARALLQVTPELREGLFQQVVARRLSVRDTERLARDVAEQRKETSVRDKNRKDFQTDANHAAMEEALQTALKTKVRIRYSAGSGRVEIDFYSDEELEGFIERLIGAG